MLKASWGGGGKGIRKVHSDDEVRQVFKQIQGEVRSVQLRGVALQRQLGQVLMGTAGNAGEMPVLQLPNTKAGSTDTAVCSSRSINLQTAAATSCCAGVFAAGSWVSNFRHEARAGQPSLGGAASGGHAWQCGVAVHTRLQCPAPPPEDH